jgi:dTDP-glucose 4,6-dehydratase
MKNLNNQYQKRILITGGAGFIGSHAVRHFVKKFPEYLIVNLDKLTYAGNLENLKDIEDYSNYVFIRGDIKDFDLVKSIFDKYQIDAVIHLAAESHVDRSIMNPLEFMKTNVEGTLVLLHNALLSWEKDFTNKLFYHISTDEVFGSLGQEGYFREDTKYDPRSPYSASKASSDHFVRSYFHTYGLPVIITNCSNNYGPYQFPEKLIPLMIHNILKRKPLPVYGTGENVRDWLWVGDHVEAMDIVFHKGTPGESYNIGGNNEWKNIDLVRLICRLTDEKIKPDTPSENLITFVTDRKGHDLRYAIDASKIKNELGWKPSMDFEEGLRKTIDWYLENKDWVERVTSGEYLHYYEKNYHQR